MLLIAMLYLVCLIYTKIWETVAIVEQSQAKSFPLQVFMLS